MDTPRPEAALRNLEAAPFAEEHVVNRHPRVIEKDFAVPVRRFVIAEHRQHALDGNAGMRQRHQDHRLLFMAILVVGICLAHHDQNLAARVERARGPPFAPVDDIFIAVAADLSLDIGGVRRRNLDFRHGKRRANFTRQQRFEPLFFLRISTVAHQHFHIAGIGRRAIKRLGAEMRAPHLFAGRRIFEIAEPSAEFAFRQE